MDRETVKTKVIEVINSIYPHPLPDFDVNVFSVPGGLNYRDLAYIFLEVEKKFQIDINKLVGLYKEATINNLIDGICNIKNVT